VTTATCARVGSDVPDTLATPARYFAIALKLWLSSRKSLKFGSARRENVPR